MLRPVEITLVGNLACVPVDSAEISNVLLECSFITRRHESEMGSRHFRARLTEDREERWAVYEMWIRGYV
jgi:hypothetical protein